jgi:hypothetical protein
MREEILRKGGAWEVGFWVGLRAQDFPMDFPTEISPNPL